MDTSTQQRSSSTFPASTPTTPRTGSEPSTPTTTMRTNSAHVLRRRRIAHITRTYVAATLRNAPPTGQYDYLLSANHERNFPLVDRFIRELLAMRTVRADDYDHVEVRNAVLTYFKSCKDEFRRTSIQKE
ncbi:hypothetical protein GGI12_005783, partial [Dipsacomyces acuminosporus]